MSSALDKLSQLQGSFDSQADEISDMINERSSTFSNAWRSKANEAVKLKDDAKEQLDELLATGTMGAQQLKGLYDRVKTVRANRAAIRAGTKSADIKPAAQENDFVSPEEGVGENDPLFSEAEQGPRSSAIATDAERATAREATATRGAAGARAAASRATADDTAEKATGMRAQAGGKSIGERVAAKTEAAESEAAEAPEASSVSLSAQAEPEAQGASSSLFGDSFESADAYRGDAWRRAGFDSQRPALGQEAPDVLDRFGGSGGVDESGAAGPRTAPTTTSYSQPEDGGSVGPRDRSNSMNEESATEKEATEAEGGGAEEAGGGSSALQGGGGSAVKAVADEAPEVLEGTEAAEGVGSSVALGAGTETAIGLAGDVLGPIGLIASIGFGIFEALDTAHAKPHDPPPQEAVSTAVSRHSLVLPSIDGVVDTPASMSAF